MPPTEPKNIRDDVMSAIKLADGTGNAGFVKATDAIIALIQRAVVEIVNAPKPEPNPEWEARAKAFNEQMYAECPDPEPLETLAMLRKWTADAEPANEQGQVSFSRAMLESAERALAHLIEGPHP